MYINNVRWLHLFHQTLNLGTFIEFHHLNVLGLTKGLWFVIANKNTSDFPCLFSVKGNGNTGLNLSPRLKLILQEENVLFCSVHWLASETYHIILMEKLEDKSILLSWKTRYSKVGLNVLLPQPPLPPPPKKRKKIKIKKN